MTCYFIGIISVIIIGCYYSWRRRPKDTAKERVSGVKEMVSVFEQYTDKRDKGEDE